MDLYECGDFVPKKTLLCKSSYATTLLKVSGPQSEAIRRFSSGLEDHKIAPFEFINGSFAPSNLHWCQIHFYILPWLVLHLYPLIYCHSSFSDNRHFVFPRALHVM